MYERLIIHMMSGNKPMMLLLMEGFVVEDECY